MAELPEVLYDVNGEFSYIHLLKGMPALLRGRVREGLSASYREIPGGDTYGRAPEIRAFV